MIKKMQKKFILIMMLLMTMVMFIAFASVYANTMYRLKEDSLKAMENALAGKNIVLHEFGIGRDDTQHTLPNDIMVINGRIRQDDSSIENSDEENSKPSILTFYAIIDKDGTIVSFHGDGITITDEKAFTKVLTECYNSTESDGIVNGDTLRYMKKKVGTNTAIVFADRTFEKATLASLRATFMLVSGGCLCIFFIVSYFLSQWLLRPVKNTLDQQMQFIADASHELKTPLTVILANTDIVASHPDDTVKNQQKWLTYIRDEADRMKELVNDMIFLAKNNNSQKVIKSDVSLSDVVWNSVLPFESVAFEKGKSLISDIEPDITIIGDEKKLRQLVVILIDNALKYANENGKISVKLKIVHGKIKLFVRNTTDTEIPQNELDHLFDRFYRVDSSRTRDSGGYGLGLAIAKMIADEHSADIKVRSSVEKGTMFTVTFHK